MVNGTLTSLKLKSWGSLHIDSLNHVNEAFLFQHHGCGHPLLKVGDKGLWFMQLHLDACFA